MLTLQERLSLIETLLPYLVQYNQQGFVRNLPDEFHINLRKVYEDIMQVSNINLACSTCIIHYLNVLASWHSRNVPPTPVEAPIQEKPATNKKKKK